MKEKKWKILNEGKKYFEFTEDELEGTVQKTDDLNHKKLRHVQEQIHNMVATIFDKIFGTK